MAEATLFSSVYDSLKVVPGAAGSVGEVLAFNKVHGYLVEAITAAEVAAAEARALLAKSNITQVIKVAGQVWVAGEAVYWDAAATGFTNVKSNLPCVGYAYEAALNAAVVGYVDFDGKPQAGNGSLMRTGISTFTGTIVSINTGLSLIVEAFITIKDTNQGAGDAAYITYDHGADGLLDLYAWDDAGAGAANACTAAWLVFGS